jgi:uncharacterized protein
MGARSNDLTRLIARVVEVAAPEKVVLFGSRAQGRPRKDSDVDLLVVAETGGDSKRAAVRIRSALSWTSGLDLIVRSPHQLAERLRIGDPFFAEIMRTGRVMYEKPGA